MASLVVEEKMLYCPKCQQTYDDGSQRFCNNDGGRLLPVSNTERSAGKTGGVFTNLLSRNAPNQERDEKLASIPRFVRAEPEQPPIPAYTPPTQSRFFESDPEDEIELELESPEPPPDEIELELGPATVAAPETPVANEPEIELPDVPAAWTGISGSIEPEHPNIAAPPEENESPFARPLGRIIRPQDIPSGRAELGDRQSHPAGREALTWDNPDVMIGQTVKGRYMILERMGEDGSGISYRAEDKIVPNKNVVVRVLMDEEDTDDFTNKIFAEERISFSHVNHPNVVGIIDSGELQEGKPFVVTEYVEGSSIRDLLQKTGQFNVSRTARIIRQASYALSEMHQNGILHRNLKSSNIILTPAENGSEQVKITGFCISEPAIGEEDLAYKAPEALEDEILTYASDVFSLGVIAYEMLTHRLPFSGSNAKQVLRSQRDGMMLHPTNLRLDVPPLADKILEKAMAPNGIDRYPKARDFGDAFYNALTTVSPWTGDVAEEVEVIPVTETEDQAPVPAAPLFIADSDVTDEIPETAYEEPVDSPEPVEPPLEPAVAAPAVTDDPAWTKRSPEPPKTGQPSWILLSIFGFVVLLGGIYAIWSYFLNQPGQPVYVPPTQTANHNGPEGPPIASGPEGTNLPASESGEIPPPPRTIDPPAQATFFQSSKQNLKGDLARNFVEFSLYYPNDWKVNEAKESSEPGTRGKFLDISRNAPNGLPVEQMLISYYESRGTFNADADKFPQLVKETHETLKEIIRDYQVLSEGKIMINGWWAYEVKFQGAGTTEKGEKLIVWGRRLFIPAARAGVKNGFEITMLATSYSGDVKSVDDVGNRGGLLTVLSTFEPSRRF
jgi:serine/threonine protein kinase